MSHLPQHQLRGAVVNVLSLLLFFLLLPKQYLAEESLFPSWLAVVLLLSMLAEPFLTYWKIDAVLSRMENWKNAKARVILVNLFTILLLWGARTAFFGALFVTSIRSLISKEALEPFVMPLIILLAVREAFIVGCYCRTESKQKVTPRMEWVIDLALVFLIAFSELMAFGLFEQADATKVKPSKIGIMLPFQLMFFVMFFLPIRMPYTIEELGNRSGTVQGRIFLTGSFLLCFIGLFYIPLILDLLDLN